MNFCPVLEAVLCPGVPEVIICCPAVGVLPRSVPGGPPNLEPCPAVATVGGKPVLTPAEASVGVSDLAGILCLTSVIATTPYLTALLGPVDVTAAG